MNPDIGGVMSPDEKIQDTRADEIEELLKLARAEDWPARPIRRGLDFFFRGWAQDEWSERSEENASMISRTLEGHQKSKPKG
jgi:hypothetical protein